MSIDINQPRFSGISTFMKLRHSRELNGVDVAIIGIPFDSGSVIRVGARFGPEAIRVQSKLYLRKYHRIFDLAPFDNLKVVDYGDMPLVPESIAETYALIEQEMRHVYSKNVVPIVLGGDHSITLPVLRAAHNLYGPIAAIHFDAHLDVIDSYYEGRIKYNNATVFRRAVDENLVDTLHSIQIGMNGSIFPEMRRECSEALGYEVVPVEKAIELGMNNLAEMILDRTSHKAVFVSFDIDVMDVTVAPGSGAPEVGGFYSREVLQLIRNLRGIKLIGLDIVEVNPLFDSGNITAILGANIAFEFLALLAWNKIN